MVPNPLDGAFRRSLIPSRSVSPSRFPMSSIRIPRDSPKSHIAVVAMAAAMRVVANACKCILVAITVGGRAIVEDVGERASVECVAVAAHVGLDCLVSGFLEISGTLHQAIWWDIKATTRGRCTTTIVPIRCIMSKRCKPVELPSRYRNFPRMFSRMLSSGG